MSERSSDSPRKAVRSDPWLLGVTLVLTLIGVVMIYSATHNQALDKYHDAYFFLKRHLVTLGLGVIAYLVASRFPLSTLRRLTYPALGFVVFLLVLVLIPPFGVKAGGAIRWLQVAGVRIGQPAELAKMAVVLYLAHSLACKKERMQRFVVGFLPHLVVSAVLIALLMKQPDFGTSMTIVAMLGVMLFVGGTRLSYLVGSGVLALPAIYLMLVLSPYRWKRIMSFLDPMAKENIQDGAYQLVQALKAFASGGVYGVGLGKGLQKIGRLPEAHTDFIFAVVGEELGLIGVLVIIALFLFLLCRGFQIALRCRDLFGSYLALGLTVMLGIQLLINMGVVMGVLPTKGMPLPFLSFARSSLVVVMASIGLLSNIERSRKELETGT